MKMEEFSLLINNNEIIIEVGKSLAKSINKNILGEKLLDNFEIKHPKFVRDASNLNNYTGNIISLIYIDNRALRLRGVINKINGGYYTFNGTLWASDTSVLNMLNLTLSDFSPLDPTPDYILLLDTKERAFSQSVDLTRNLQQLRDKLERSIRSRITELEVTNRALEKSKIASDNLARQVSSMARKRELLEDRLIKTAERERSQLGLYLHDDLLQQLTGTALFLTSCANRLRGSNKDIAFEIDCSAGYVRDAIKISRNLLHGLLTVDVTTLGIQPLFAELRNALASMYGIKCHVNTSENLSFSDRVARHLYYIAREAAFNAAKHTNATKIEILLLQNCNHIKLEIIDDGSVTKSKDSKQRGYGIEIMKIRARILNASLKIINNKNTGTKLTCSLSGYGVGP